MMLVALWNLRDPGTNKVSNENKDSRVNDAFVRLGRPALSITEFHVLLEDLCKMGSIELNEDGSITLVEEIRKTY